MYDYSLRVTDETGLAGVILPTSDTCDTYSSYALEPMTDVDRL